MRKHARISLDAQQTLFNDVCQRPTIEACGVLLGLIDSCGSWIIEQAYPLRNIYDSAVYFEFAPEELLEVELEHPGRIVGVYHSHPTGFAVASSTDHENMRRVNVEQQIPWVWLIIRGPFDERFEVGEKSSMIAYHYCEELELQEIAIVFDNHSPPTHP